MYEIGSLGYQNQIAWWWRWYREIVQIREEGWAKGPGRDVAEAWWTRAGSGVVEGEERETMREEQEQEVALSGSAALRLVIRAMRESPGMFEEIYGNRMGAAEEGSGAVERNMRVNVHRGSREGDWSVDIDVERVPFWRLIECLEDLATEMDPNNGMHELSRT